MTTVLAAVAIERGVEAVMRDGCVLRADVYRPLESEGPLPVLLQRTPYDRRAPTETVYAHPLWYARRGFLVVAQDTRGRCGSDGAFRPFAHEAADGYDSVEWAAALPGASGRVGLYGASYIGFSQLLTALEAPPSLAAIAPAIGGSDLTRNWLYEGGALNLAFVSWWATQLGADLAARSGDDDLLAAAAAVLRAPAGWYATDRPYDLDPAARVPFYREWLDHPPDDAYWDPYRLTDRLRDLAVPALFVGGWYDVFNQGTLRGFRAARDGGRAPHRLVVGPWGHTPWGTRVGSLRMGDDASGTTVDDLQAAFFAQHLAGAGGGIPGPPVRYYRLFEDRWHDAPDWPPPGGVASVWYLSSGGRADSAGGDGVLTPTAPAAP